MNNGTVVLVLGMHRSGTSAVTRVLNLLGVPLGADMLRPGGDNRKGFWEHSVAVDIHERLLADLGRSWYDVGPMPDGWLDHPATVRAAEEISTLLDAELEVAGLWAVKDPRMCRLAPLWLRVLEARATDVKVVMVVRDPREVALSIRARDGWAISHSYLMWIQHFVEALTSSQGVPRAMVCYTQLLRDWRPVMRRVSDEIGLAWPGDLDEAAGEIDQFISPGDRHQRVEKEKDNPELETAPLPPVLAETYAKAQGVARGELAWEVLGDVEGKYEENLPVFWQALRETVEDRTRIERIAVERMDVINGLVIAKDNIERRSQELQGKLEEQAALVAELSKQAMQFGKQAEHINELLIARQVAESREAQVTQQLHEQAAEFGRISQELRRAIEQEQLLLAERDVQNQELSALRLDHRELLCLRDGLARERLFIEQAFSAADKLAEELRTRIGERTAEVERLGAEMHALTSAFATKDAAERDEAARRQEAELRLAETEAARKDELARREAAEHQVTEVKAALEDELAKRRQEAQLFAQTEDALREELARLDAQSRELASALESTRTDLRRSISEHDEVKISRDELAGQFAKVVEAREELADGLAAANLENQQLRQYIVELDTERAREHAKLNSRRWLVRSICRRLIGKHVEVPAVRSE